MRERVDGRRREEEERMKLRSLRYTRRVLKMYRVEWIVRESSRKEEWTAARERWREEELGKRGSRLQIYGGAFLEASEPSLALGP